MSQVTWDEPEILQNAKRVSPWQIEFVSPTQPLHTAFPPAKRLKFSQNYGSIKHWKRKQQNSKMLLVYMNVIRGCGLLL